MTTVVDSQGFVISIKFDCDERPAQKSEEK